MALFSRYTMQPLRRSCTWLLPLSLFALSMISAVAYELTPGDFARIHYGDRLFIKAGATIYRDAGAMRNPTRDTSRQVLRGTPARALTVVAGETGPAVLVAIQDPDWPSDWPTGVVSFTDVGL